MEPSQLSAAFNIIPTASIFVPKLVLIAGFRPSAGQDPRAPAAGRAEDNGRFFRNAPNVSGRCKRTAQGGINALWYFVNQQFSEVSSPLTPHFEIQQFSECSRRSLLPNLPCEYRLELFKLPRQRIRLLSPVPNSLNRPNLSPLFYAHFSLFLSMEGTRSASPLCTAYSDLIPQFALSRSSLNCQAAMCHRHPKESGRVVPLLSPCTLLATTFE